MRKLTERDRGKLLEYVGAEPEVNLFFIGDVENFGVESDEVGIWAFGSEETRDSVVLRFMNNFVVYSRNAGYDAGEVGAFLRTQNPGMISGRLDLIDRLKGFFPERHLSAETLSKCVAVMAEVRVPDGTLLRRLTPDDAEELAALLAGIEEFRVSYGDVDASIRKLRKNLAFGSTGVGLYSDGMLISTAQTTAENSVSAMVVAVATHPAFRGRGCASAVVSGLCREAFRNGKKFLCLFYDNPQAGRIYNRLGFEPVGQYALLG